MDPMRNVALSGVNVFPIVPSCVAGLVVAIVPCSVCLSVTPPFFLVLVLVLVLVLFLFLYGETFFSSLQKIISSVLSFQTVNENLKTKKKKSIPM